MLAGFSKLLSNSDRIMKKIIAGMVLAAMLWGCQESDAIETVFTGNETVYSLQAGSLNYPAINGTATFREKKDGSTVISISLTGTEGNLQHPVHLHMGTIATPDADVAALLTPVSGLSGKSETTLTILADESAITYNQLISLDACIKIHLAEAGPDRDIILAGGNIGNSTAARTSDRIAVCKSE